MSGARSRTPLTPGRLAAAAALLLFFVASASDALEVKKETLPNGLTVLHVERHNLPIVVATLLVRASPRNEPAEKAGMAYLTAKMLTEGTATRTSRDISAEIEFIGASLDASANSDYTVVSLSVLKKDIERGFALFSDILVHPTFPEDEVTRKKALLKGSLRQKEEEPGFVAEKRFMSEVFGDHPYGRLVEGSITTIDALAREDLLRFYRQHYTPHHALLAVVGDLTPQELAALLERSLAGWSSAAKGQAEQTSSAPTPPAGFAGRSSDAGPQGPRIIVIDRDITQANILLGHRGISREDPDYYAVNIMNYILGGGGFASRLMKAVRDDMGLAYSIHSSFSPNKEPGAFQVEVQTKNESAATVIAEILKQMRKMKEQYVSDQELRDAQSFLKGSFPRRLETTRRIADFLTAVRFFNLGDDYIEKYPEHIDAVTKEEVLRVARKYLHDTSYVLVVVGKKAAMDLAEFQRPEKPHQLGYRQLPGR